jgi:hypothetical protein
MRKINKLDYTHIVDEENEKKITPEMKDRFNSALMEVLG